MKHVDGKYATDYTYNSLTHRKMAQYGRPNSIHSGEPINLVFGNQSQGWVKNGEAGYPNMAGR